jgi:hypothetical protein
LILKRATAKVASSNKVRNPVKNTTKKNKLVNISIGFLLKRAENKINREVLVPCQNIYAASLTA